MTENKTYSYAASVKSGISDEFINTYLIRPLAGVLVRIVFSTPLTPNHITIASTLAGLVAAFFYLEGTAAHNVAAGLCITAKDVLDSADGQLARAKQQYSRAGRFLDSIGDFVVNAFVFGSITIALLYTSDSLFTVFLGLLGFAGITLRVSYHVFYQTSFLHLGDSYTLNRITEEIKDEDVQETGFTLRLQRVFQLMYGWQDRLMMRIDRWCRSGLGNDEASITGWFGDRAGLRLSGLIGLGTELFILMVFSVSNELHLYLIFNIVVLNGVWLASVLYRKMKLAPALRDAHRPAHP